MMNLPFAKIFFLFFFVGAFCLKADVDVQKLPDHAKQLEFVPVDDPNNQPDSETGLGAVQDSFQIGMYKVTANQYAAFLSSVAAKSDPYHLFDNRMEKDPAVACIQRIWKEELKCYEYVAIEGREDFPITYVDLFCCAYFCNWLTLGFPRGEGSSELIQYGAYAMTQDGDQQSIERIPGSLFFLPAEDQWYKAAYYHHDPKKIISCDPEDPITSVQKTDSILYWNYPTQTMSEPWNGLKSSVEAANYFRSSNWWYSQYTTGKEPYLTPVGTFQNTPGPYGTFDMGGNVHEWTFSLHDSEENGESFTCCFIHGGSWASGSSDLHRKTRHALEVTARNNTTGFRIACQAMPQPKQLKEKKEDLTQEVIDVLVATNVNISAAAEWALWNVGGEMVEVVALQYVGPYMILPYCLYMGSVITHEYLNKDYYGAAGSIVHAVFDIACMLGSAFISKIAQFASSRLEEVGLGCVSRFFGMIHESIHDLMHYIGIADAHNHTGITQPQSSEEAETLTKEVERVITPAATREEASSSYCQPVGRTSASRRGCRAKGCDSVH